MVESAPDVFSFRWGTIQRNPAGTSRLPASYDANGTRYLWFPSGAIDGTLALDVELLSSAPPPLLRERFADVGDFWTAWTRTEVACKLSDIPIAVWLRRFGLEEDGPSRAHLTEAGLAGMECGSLIWPSQSLVFSYGWMGEAKWRAL